MKQNGISASMRFLRWLLWLSPALCLPWLYAAIVHRNSEDPKAVEARHSEPHQEHTGCVELNCGEVTLDSFDAPVRMLASALKEEPKASGFHVKWTVPVPLGTVYCSVRYLRTEKRLRYWSQEASCEKRPLAHDIVEYTGVEDSQIQSIVHGRIAQYSEGFERLPDYGCHKHDLTPN